MRKRSPKLISVVKKSVQVQMEFSVDSKVNRLLEMLELIVEGTRYERDVIAALDSYHKAVDKDNGNL
jgi:hypothetical protein